jgi:tRNA(Ile)-lysidine synthase
MAMLHLAAGWARAWGVGLRVVTVDHGLRPEAAAEAAMVADEARGLGLSHDTLRWGGWDGRGNLQDAARRARLDLIGRWRGDISHVLFAHTEDDQAETFLMRLRRGSGVEGLGAMRPLRRVEAPEGAWWVVRPMLEMRRAELRHYLGVLRIPFADDPSNDDPAYDRVRMRRLLDVLEEEGLGRTVLSVTAARMRRAAEALGCRAADVAARIAASEAGDLLFDRDALAAVEEDTRLRLLAAALHMVGGGDYRPRAAALEDAADRAMSGGAATLAGCRIVAEGARIRVFREHAAVASLVAPASPGAIWDGRWRITGPGLAGGEIRALGEAGLALCPDWRDSGLPRASLEATPAIWAGQRLVAAPVARSGGDWRAAPVKDHSAFIAFLLAH